MIERLDLVWPLVFGFSAVLYFLLAFRIARVTSSETNAISYFLFLLGARLAGSAFVEGTDDPNMYGIGQTLTFFSAGFLPVVLYQIYREFSVGRPHPLLLALFCIVPALTTVLAVTNPLHHMIWDVVVSVDGVRFTEPTEHWWFSRVAGPASYGLFGYAMLALAGRLPTIARAHRRPVILLLIGAGLPYAVSLGNTILGFGPADVPLPSLTLVVLMPLYWWATVATRVHEFSPLAYQTMFDQVRDPIIVLDRAERIISANRPAQSLLGAPEPQLTGRPIGDHLPEVREILDHAGGRDISQTMRMEPERYFEVSATRLIGPAGQHQGSVLMCRDVTERNVALRALADSEHLIRSLVEQSSNGILRFARGTEVDDDRFRCIFANRAAERFLGSGDVTLVGMPLEKLHLLEPARLIEHFSAGGMPTSAVSYEMSVETLDDENWLRVIGEPVGSDFSVTLIDITQRKRAENQILEDSLRDPLTGILNRRGFEKHATLSIAACGQGAVLYLDLNQFKSINDRFGHQAGDALLKAFGHRLEFCLRPEDILARLGGDEFAIVLPGVSLDDAKHVAARLLESASEAYIIQGNEIECAASVGIALMPAHGTELWQLVSVADQAMYSAKSLGQNDAVIERTRPAIASVVSR